MTAQKPFGYGRSDLEHRIITASGGHNQMF
jgi:hypothetical protein